MPISDLFGLLQKRQTTPEKYLASSVNVVGAGQYGSVRAPFSPHRGIQSYRSWVYAAATINAQAVAALPIRLYVKGGESRLSTRAIPKHRMKYLAGDMAGDVRPSMSVVRKASKYGADLEEVDSMHPVCQLLASANPFLNGFDLATLRILYGELTGNAYLHPIVDEATGHPGELWPLAPQYVEVIPDEDEFVSGYVYGVDHSRKQIFERDEVIHFRRPNPSNLYYGLGKVEAAYGAVQSNEAIHQMDLSTFENSARPDYAVVVKGNPTGDQLDRFQTQVEQRLRGTRKDGSFVTVTGDVQFTPLNFPPKDIAGREEIVEEIAAIFGVPVTMLKANDPNLASAQTGFAQWREGTILPLCRMDEEELNQSLLPLFGLDERYCLAYDNPVPADKQYELQERQTAVAGGWRTPNEARMEEGREPIDDEFADRLLVNGQPIGGGVGSVGFDLGGPFSSPISDEPETPTQPVEAPEAAPSSEPATALNGAQIASVVAVLDGVAGGNIVPIAAIELIVASGLGRPEAERMVESQQQAKPAAEVEAEIEEDVQRESEDVAGKLLADLRSGRLSRYAATKLLQSAGHTRKQADRMISSALSRTVEKVHRMPGEPLDECIERGIEVLTAEGYDRDQAVAMAYSQCEKAKTTKAIEDVDLQPTEEMAALAERGLRLREEHGRGGTEVGVARARNIKNRDNLSPDTVGRMSSFFSRHRVDLDAPAAKPGHEDYPSAGVIAWLLWGGDPANPDEAGAAWSERKLEELERAEEKNGDDASTPAKPSERIEGSDENPEGSASDTRGGIEISDEQEKALKTKVEEHNEEHGDDPAKKVDLGMLKAVYRRGAGAFSTSHRPGMTRQQWAMARVNSFLYLVRNGKPESAKYVTDNDLLPKEHPKYEPKDEKEDKSCGCCETKAAKVYEWPKEVEQQRLQIEGLEDDFARLRPKAAGDEPTADDDIREGESKTPAMMIRSIVANGLQEVQDRLVAALESGEVSSVPQKANGREAAIRKILADMAGVKGKVLDDLVAALEKAAKGGGSVGVDRINQLLGSAGGQQIGSPDLSDRLSKAIQKRATTLATAVIDETIEQFASGLDQTFSIDAEVERLRTSYGYGKERATVIARTESANAYHEGQIDAWKESGVVREKHFLKAANACEFCQAVEKQFGEGKKALPIDAPMVKAGQTISGTRGGTMKVGRSSAGIVHPNCRCDFVPVLEDFG